MAQPELRLASVMSLWPDNLQHWSLRQLAMTYCPTECGCVYLERCNFRCSALKQYVYLARSHQSVRHYWCRSVKVKYVPSRVSIDDVQAPDIKEYQSAFDRMFYICIRCPPPHRPQRAPILNVFGLGDSRCFTSRPPPVRVFIHDRAAQPVLLWSYSTSH